MIKELISQYIRNLIDGTEFNVDIHLFVCKYKFVLIEKFHKLICFFIEYINIQKFNLNIKKHESIFVCSKLQMITLLFN